ncbi:MAG: DUF1513 domain-containing protein [Pseudomonadota bacterium]
MPTRRKILGGLAAALTCSPTWADVGTPAYIAAAREPDGTFALYGIGAEGADRFRIVLPGRGHAAAAHPRRPEAVAFARRPGLFALAIDCRTGQVTARLQAPAGRHFYGHGCFSSDGSILYTTENAFESGAGRIGLWSTDEGYRRIGERASGGIGPHDVVRLPGTETLAVANGGIRTHPASGREKLNIETMRPSLAYLDEDGSIDDLCEPGPEIHRNSIRHLSVRADGLVACAMQWQGDPFDAPPLLALHKRGSPLRLVGARGPLQALLRAYAGSVAFSGGGDRVGFTAPRGGRAQVYSVEDGRLLQEVRRPDICGIAPHRNGFLATDGTGGVSAVGAVGLHTLTRANRAWDNHLISIEQK